MFSLGLIFFCMFNNSLLPFPDMNKDETIMKLKIKELKISECSEDI
jgi:hypothetical protein